MTSARQRSLGGRRVLLADDPVDLGIEGTPGGIVICAAPATLRTARALLRHAPALVILHDAGVGMDGAGIAGLERLQAFHVPAAAVGHDSARVGDADDVLERGSIQHLNASARAAGLEVGSVTEALKRFLASSAGEEGGPSTVPAAGSD